MTAIATKLSCFLCSSFAGSSFSDVFRHIQAVHAHDPDFHITCGLDGCVRRYDKFGSYKVHLYREHRGHILGLGTMSSQEKTLLMLVSAVFTTYCTARGAVIGIVRSLMILPLLILSIDAVVSGEC